MTALNDCTTPDRAEVLADFEVRWSHDALVMDKWFTLQALSRRDDTLAAVERLLSHPGYDAKNPNKVYALVRSFATANRQHFHAADGSGYRFIVGQVIATDPHNKMVAARLVLSFGQWRRFDPLRQGLMRGALEQILAAPGLSKDVYEIVAKSLG